MKIPAMVLLALVTTAMGQKPSSNPAQAIDHGSNQAGQGSYGGEGLGRRPANTKAWILPTNRTHWVDITTQSVNTTLAANATLRPADPDGSWTGTPVDLGIMRWQERMVCISGMCGYSKNQTQTDCVENSFHCIPRAKFLKLKYKIKHGAPGCDNSNIGRERKKRCRKDRRKAIKKALRFLNLAAVEPRREDIQ